MTESKIRVSVEFEGNAARIFREVKKKTGYKWNQSLVADMMRKALEAERDLYHIRR
jgi:hypothetical protein